MSSARQHTPERHPGEKFVDYRKRRADNAELARRVAHGGQWAPDLKSFVEASPRPNGGHRGRDGAFRRAARKLRNQRQHRAACR